MASVIRSLRGAHSEKPQLVYEMIERMYPALPKLELFAGGRREGWSAWGNQPAAQPAGSLAKAARSASQD
jgi:N6-adenosine-specific RNA methylase IME4